MSFILKCLTPSACAFTQAVRRGVLASPCRFIGTAQTTEDEVVVLPDIDVSFHSAWFIQAAFYELTEIAFSAGDSTKFTPENAPTPVKIIIWAYICEFLFFSSI